MAPASPSTLRSLVKTFKIVGWSLVGLIAVGYTAIWLVDWVASSRSDGTPAANEESKGRAPSAQVRQKEPPALEEIRQADPVAELDAARAGNYPWHPGEIPSLDSIRKKASRAAWEKANRKIDLRERKIEDDSIEKVHIPLEDTVFGMILAYRKAIATGSSCGGWPDLPIEDTARHPDAPRLLPRVARSDFLEKRRIFFLGGGPFSRPDDAEDGHGFTNPSGQPEFRRIIGETDNAERAIEALRCHPGSRIDVRPGSPLPSYESGPLDAHGIGTLEHVLLDRLPVLYITRKGLVPAEILSVSVKLPGQDLCVPAGPAVRFAAHTLPETDVLGVILSPDSIPFASAKVHRSRNLWTADIDGDGIPEFAALARDLESFGAAGTVIELFWYANLGGAWRLIDHAVEVDCT